MGDVFGYLVVLIVSVGRYGEERMCSCLTREKDLKLMKAVEQVEDSGISEDLAITHSLFMYLLWTLVEGDRREKRGDV